MSAPFDSPEQQLKDSPGANSFVAIVNDQAHVECIRYDAFVALLFKQMPEHLMKLHAVIGMCGEAGELADAIKKETIYGKPADVENIVEELGDLRFYIQATMQLYGISEQQVLQTNANKLAVRYKGLTYSDSAAQERADKKTGK